MKSSRAYPALAGRLGQILVDVELVALRASHLLEKARQSGDDGYLDGVALNLHSFYAGIESCFEDIARTVDDALPSGGNWHQELMQQMAAEMRDLRPAVISRETRDCLDEYRAFRHLVRNIYTFNLKPARLTELAANVEYCLRLVQEDLNGFIDFLNTVAAE
ncbi:MAG: hypothetical protein ACLFUE_08260 [Desulfobacteraceae bacterium]